MMKSKHTPGPWTVLQVCDKLYICTGEQGNIPLNSLSIADVKNKNKANAHLIAAAPDLLFAIEGLVEAMKSEGYPLPFQALTQQAASAIAKARS